MSNFVKMKQDFKILSAPLQGYTGHVWRSTHARIFGGIDCYYSPFMRMKGGSLMSRDVRDVQPENNNGYNFVPQVLAGTIDDTVAMVLYLKSLGYNRVDLNMGCPFPPIARHAKGSGILCYPQRVEALFKRLASIDGLKYSIKMRLGYNSADDWRRILPLIPIIDPMHIVIHPRTGIQQYSGDVDITQFLNILQSTTYPVIYNGDIARREDIVPLMQRFDEMPGSNIAGVMIGRALVANPAMLTPEKADRDHYRTFHDAIYAQYRKELTGGSVQLLNAMKAFWNMYLPQSDRKCRKRIGKAHTIAQYELATAQLFELLP